jgi:hypothetical protein
VDHPGVVVVSHLDGVVLEPLGVRDPLVPERTKPAVTTLAGGSPPRYRTSSGWA